MLKHIHEDKTDYVIKLNQTTRNLVNVKTIKLIALQGMFASTMR